MKRRRLLSSVAIALCGFLAGCSDGTGNTDANASTDSATATRTRSTGATTTAARTTGTTRTETTTEESTGTVGSRTFTESGKPRGPQTVTARVPATEAATPVETATPATTLSTATETTRGPADTPTPIPIPDALGTQTGMGTSTISFENDGSRVVVDGTITGKDGCRKAVLESVQPNGGNLVITVGTERDAGTNTMCTQALTPVTYQFVVTPDTPPDSVTVVHTGTGGRRTITTADRGG